MSKMLLVLPLAALVAATGIVAAQQAAATDGPIYISGALQRPANYREWPFLSSGLGMTYKDPAPGQAPPQFFDNVFVNPSSYRAFMQTGKWPDKTILVLEIRSSASAESINKAGRFQTSVTGLEAHVKDARFPDGWAFFSLGAKQTAEPLAGQDVAQCVDCHQQHTAVERTFVQFYPTLLEVARQKGTVKPGF